jgi:hypothetical protein
MTCGSTYLVSCFVLLVPVAGVVGASEVVRRPRQTRPKTRTRPRKPAPRVVLEYPGC